MGIAVRNVARARRRTALLSTAIAAVTLLLVLLQSIGQGIEDNLVRAATTVSAGHVNVAGFFKATANTASPFLTNRHEIRSIVEQSTPELDYIIERHRGWVKIVSESGSTYAALTGIEAEGEDRFLDTVRLVPEAQYVDGGSTETRGDPRELALPHTILLFENQARRLAVRVGDTVTLQAESPGGQINTLDSRVVGVAEDMGFMTSWTVFVPSNDVRAIYDVAEGTTGALWLYLEDIDDAPRVMTRLREVFERSGYRVMEHQAAPYFLKFETANGEDWTGQKLDLTTWKDEVSYLTWVITGFRTLTWFLVLVLVAIVAVGIMNTMWNAVRDRTAEIGTMRAIGMRRSRVLALVLLEALILGLVATTFGAALGAAVASGVNALGVAIDVEAVRAVLLSDQLRLSVTPTVLLQSIALLTTFTVVASLWPARRAARLPPITAILHAE
jgi:putative ABC transport system permease protein